MRRRRKTKSERSPRIAMLNKASGRNSKNGRPGKVIAVMYKHLHNMGIAWGASSLPSIAFKVTKIGSHIARRESKKVSRRRGVNI